MRKSVRALCIVVALTGGLLLLAAPALANYTHVFASSIGEAGSGDGQMELLGEEFGSRGGSGVAVNAGTHDVYVADTGNHRVDEFSASGAFVRTWGWGVADGTAEALQTCTSGCHAGLAGGGAGQLNEPSFIAVDNSGGPSEGDVYVADREGSGRRTFVTKFTASGAYVASNDGGGAVLPLAGPFGTRIGGIAVDRSGNLWVYALDKGGLNDPTEGFGDVFEFGQDGSFVTDWTTYHFIRGEGMAINSAGDLFLRSLAEYTSAGDLVGYVIDEEGPQPVGVAVNAGNDELYVDNGAQIVRYPASCDPVNAFCASAEEFGSGNLSFPEGLAVDASDDTVYVADIGNGRIAAFGRTPDVSTGQPATRTSTTVLLNGTVDPENTPIGDCHFDYVVNAEYAQDEPDPYAAGGTVPCDITPTGSGAADVHAEVTGLTPGAIYHFRLQATNAHGTTFGGDETLAGTAPMIRATSAIDVSSASAQLRAEINPAGGITTFRFEYGPTTSYGTSIPVPDGNIGSGTADVTVLRRVQGLSADTTYHYRIVARNPLGTIFGPDRVFVTQLVGGGGGVDTCPNAAVRALQRSVELPDCRAYEQVSPPDRNGAPILGRSDVGAVWQASADGSSITYTSSDVFANAQAGASILFPYLSSRSSNGWSTRSLLPPQSTGEILPFVEMNAFSTDLSKGVLLNGGGSTSHGQDEPQLVTGEPAGNVNLFLRDNTTNSYQLIDLTPPGVTPEAAELRQASADLGVVLFNENAQLTPESLPAGGQPQLYEWSGGVVRLAGILPNGSPVPTAERASVPGSGERAIANSHAVSEDGARVFFEAGPPFAGQGSGALYLRENGLRTTQVDAAHGAGPGGAGQFAVASSSGSVVYFIDEASAGLTSDTVPGSRLNLYRYEVGGKSLTDLTPVAGADVQGVVGASEDGSYVYYVANGVLAPGASPGNCTGAGSGSPSAVCNLYLFHDGVTTFIAGLNGEDLGDWNDSDGLNNTAAASPSGHYLAFQSLNDLTGYDNLAANGTQCGADVQPRCSEVFLYDAVAGKLSCVSCNPSGAAPVGSSLIAVPRSTGVGVSDRAMGHQLRYLSDSGRVFFNSLDALRSQDVNDQWDVYEYEPGGIGSCQLNQGCLSEISSGTSPDASIFRDASVTGEDVFFTTGDTLVAQDGDVSRDMYDARVDGGIALQNPVAGTTCEGEGCKPPVAARSTEPTPGSASVSGQGNLSPAIPSAIKPVKKKIKPKPKKKRRLAKRKRSKSRRGHARRATRNRGGAK